MAKIVCIAEGTVREGICEVGDVVSVHDDNVELTGSGYAHTTVLHFPGLTAEQVRESMGKLQPEESVAFKTEAAAGEWGLDSPEEKRVWKNSEGKWNFLDAPPKYRINLVGLTEVAKTSLEDSLVSSAARLITFEGQVAEKVSLDSKNLVEATDLNKV